MSDLDNALNFVADNATVDEPFLEQYARAELAQLRATVAAQAEHIVQMADEFSVASICEALGIDDNDDRTPSQIVSDAARLLTQQAGRIAWLTSDIGESGLAAINRLIAACNRDDIGQQYMPDLSIARDEIVRQAEQLSTAYATAAKIATAARGGKRMKIGTLGSCWFCGKPNISSYGMSAHLRAHYRRGDITRDFIHTRNGNGYWYYRSFKKNERQKEEQSA